MRVSLGLHVLLLVTLAACSGASPTQDSTTPPQSDRGQPRSVTLSPDSLVLGTWSDTARFVATVRDGAGATLTGVTLTWTTSDTTVAKVDGSGLVTSVKPGQVTVSAVVGALRTERRALVKLQPNARCSVPTAFPTKGAVRGQPTFAPADSIAALPLDLSITDAAVVDADADGDQDVLVFNSTYPGAAEEQPYRGVVRVWRNNGSGQFTDAPDLLGTSAPTSDHARDAEVADFNGDGRPDLFVGQHGYDAPPFPGAGNLLFLSQTNGLREEGASRLQPADKAFTHSVAAADVDCDGDVDVFEGNIGPGPGPHLQINHGGGGFFSDDSRLPADVVTLRRKYTSSDFCDVDRDGDEDLILGGWDTGGARRDALLVNDGFGRFRHAPDSALPSPYFTTENVTAEIACGDVDLDGWPDLLISATNEYKSPHLALWRNAGNGTFADVTATNLPQTWVRPSYPWATTFWVMRLFLADLNRDPWPDIVASNLNCASRAYVNTGEGRFTQLDVPFTTGDCATWNAFLVLPIEANGDGRTDLMVVQSKYQTRPVRSVVLRNTGP